MGESRQVIDVTAHGVPEGASEERPGAGSAPSDGRRGRRLSVFLGLFGCLGALTLTYCFLRPPVYRAEASLILKPTPPQATEISPPGPSPAGKSDLVVAHQVLLSRSMLEKVREELSSGNGSPEPVRELGTDEIARMVGARMVPEGNLIRLFAEGSDRTVLLHVLRTWIRVYLATFEESQKAALAMDSETLDEEVRALEARLESKRQELELYRQVHDIVSLEREENQLVSRLRGLNESLARARETLVTAESRLKALLEARARGEDILEGRELRAVLSLQEKAEALRDQLRDLRERYTEKYMNLDPRVRGLRAQLERIERKIVQTRTEAEAAALDKARQDVETARRSVVQLEAQVAEHEEKARDFNAKFARHQALVEELKDLEALYRRRKEQRIQREVSPAQHVPRLSVLEQPEAGENPVRPHYLRDAGIGMAGVLVVSLFGLWLFEFLLRSPRKEEAAGGPTLIFQPNVSRSMEPPPPKALLEDSAGGAVPGPARELSPLEIEAMMGAADPVDGALVYLLLTGLRADEVATLRWGEVDLEKGWVRLSGNPPRLIPLEGRGREALKGLLESYHREPPDKSAPVFVKEDGAPMTAEEIRARLLFLAQDAGLASPGAVTPDALRHTYLLFLVRQGIRLSALEQVAGPVDGSFFSRYGAVAPPGPGRDPEEVARVLPVFLRTSDGN
ncbi:Uncharacterized protein involved in exopolysaccharide biosynthesis [Desulfacinum infernum DSM 9756]|uniref:Uncharacterized protein involved in exopolysaccharide biosynthesis n=1 Tax=Desulfacinum infernum DSM 9756 TaxID=1121391 RepID=A0A1M5ERA2_9BACT|nr:tyrosine-type recombinase/integrase [Desulfacinum infernum]SHF81651.1 Uncharacterized protein involved in exopolysaccharide biosynthesis [Desulfacinum infernum DSM 9756]